MDFSMASFVAGIFGGVILLLYVQSRFPGLLPNSNEEKMIEKISHLEDRLDKKDELIRKAIKSTSEGEHGENK